MGRMTACFLHGAEQEGGIGCGKNNCCLYDVPQEGRWDSMWEEKLLSVQCPTRRKVR